MPELPEVETVVRDLRPLLVGRCITGVRQSRERLRRPWRPSWNQRVCGQRVAAVRRRGKWILIDLMNESNNSTTDADRPLLRVHLGMTGQFTVCAANDQKPNHLHMCFSLDDDCELRYRDPRRFGAVEYFDSGAKVEHAMNAALGPEPFQVNGDYFASAVTGSSRNLKAILLDQRTLAGVGNIYADEACFRAKLHPGRKGASLSRVECDRLREAIEAVLTRAIQSRGSTIRDYIGGSGLSGGFQNEFAVYARTDEPCTVCTTLIQCARYAGRSSHFCRRCQPASLRIRHAQATGKQGKRHAI